MTTHPRLARDITAAVRAALPDPDRSVATVVQRGNSLLKPVIEVTVPYEYGVRRSDELAKVVAAVKQTVGVDVELTRVDAVRYSRNKPGRRRLTLVAQQPLQGDSPAAEQAFTEEAAKRAATVVARADARRRP